jgi:glycosyltransferase involved in cell wall biosynthesis
MLISVVIAAYNAEKFIGETIESVLRQSYSDFELLLVDDGSSDCTLEIMKGYEMRDPRIRVLAQQNQGAAAARNNAVSVARSEWISVLDADDMMEPDCLERQIAFVEQHPELAMTSCLVNWVDQNGRRRGQSQPVMTADAEVAEAHESGVIAGVFNSGAFIRKWWYEHVDGYRTDVWPGEDLDLWVRIADTGGRILVQPEYLLNVRLHASSATFQKARETPTVIQWIACCSKRRRAGLPEPSLEEFRRARRDLPLHRRLNESRKDLAYAFYRQAVVSYSTRSMLKSGWYLLGATLMGSADVPRQIWWRLVRPLIRRLSISGRGEPPSRPEPAHE